MKLLCHSVLCIPLLLSTSLAAQKADVPLSIHIESFHLVHISGDRAEAVIDLSVTAGLDARIDRIGFSGIHANGVPFFAQPLAAYPGVPIEVRRNRTLSLPPLAVTVYTGDLDSLDPLIAVLDQHQTRLQADLAVRVQATPLERLLLRDAHPLAMLAIDQNVEVEPPGGLFGRASAIALLRAARIAMAGASRLPTRLSFVDPAWRTQMDIAQTALLHARACYAPARKNANETCIDRMAFAVGPQDALSTAELGAPWRFDPHLAKSFAEQGGHLQPGDPRFTLDSLNTDASPMSASIQSVGSAAETKVILLPSRARLTVFDPQPPGLYARLHTPSGVAASVFRVPPGQPDCERVAVFRLSHSLEGDWLPRAVYLAGSLAGQTITFSRPVDRSAVGSPILTPLGVIGVVQSETTGTLLSPSSY